MAAAEREGAQTDRGKKREPRTLGEIENELLSKRAITVIKQERLDFSKKLPKPERPRSLGRPYPAKRMS